MRTLLIIPDELRSGNPGGGGGSWVASRGRPPPAGVARSLVEAREPASRHGHPDDCPRVQRRRRGARGDAAGDRTPTGAGPPTRGGRRGRRRPSGDRDGGG